MVTLTIDFSEVGRGGVREKVETTPNTLLSDVLKQAWVRASERGRRNSEDARALDSATMPPLPATWTLRYGQRLLDLSLPFRLSGLTGHARVVVVDRGTQEHTKPGRLDRARAGARVPTAASSSEALSVAVQFEDSSPGRSIVRASPEDTLWTVLLRADSERVWRYQPCLLIARYLESTYFGVAHFYNLRLRDLGLDAGMRPLIRIQCSGTDDDSAGWHTLAVASCAAMASDGGSSADTVAKREVSEDSARRSDNSLGVAAASSTMGLSRQRAQQLRQERHEQGDSLGRETPSLPADRSKGFCETDSATNAMKTQQLLLHRTSVEETSTERNLTEGPSKPSPVKCTSTGDKVAVRDSVTQHEDTRAAAANALPVSSAAACVGMLGEQEKIAVDAENSRRKAASCSAGDQNALGNDVFTNPASGPDTSGQETEPGTSALSLEVLRQVRFYRPAATPIDGRLLDLPDAFYDLTPEELRRIVQTQQRLREETSILQIRGASNTQRSMRPAREICVIRFRLPDSVVIEGRFWCDEKLSDMYAFARQYLEDAFQADHAFALYQTPPKRLLPAVATTLHEAQLCPASVLVLVPSTSRNTLQAFLRPQYRARLERSPQEAAFAREIAQAAALRREWDKTVLGSHVPDTVQDGAPTSAASPDERLVSTAAHQRNRGETVAANYPASTSKVPMPKWWRPHRS